MKFLAFKHKGMTLLEVIIVLGIMGVIAAGVVVLAQRAIDNQNLMKLSNGLNSIQTAMVSTYRVKSSYPAITGDTESQQLKDALIAMGKLSKEDTVNSYSGDALNIFSAASNSKANKAFIIEVKGLTHQQCTAVVNNSVDLFPFIDVQKASDGSGGGSSRPSDIFTVAVATDGLGVLKSPAGGDAYDVSNIEHITALCGGQSAEAKAAYYDVYVGGQ